MQTREQQYFYGASVHNFVNNENFRKYRSVLREIYDENLKDSFFFEDKYHATKDLRPNACKYDDSIIGVLMDSGIHQKMIDLFGYEMFLCHTQVRISFNQQEFSYMPWHRDTYVYEDGKVVGPTPPMKKVIYYPKFDDIDNTCLLLALGSHLKAKHVKSEDMDQLKHLPITNIKNSTDQFVIFNTECLHHAVPPENEKQLRVIYSFCPIGQLDHHDDKTSYENYMRQLNENIYNK
tara:strand:+ start:111 stop:815 length:705 start_codon:yes stop_codon:yes gene_type:complete